MDQAPLAKLLETAQAAQKARELAAQAAREVAAQAGHQQAQSGH